MKIIELTNTQYRNFSNAHSYRNFGQSIEFSMIQVNFDKKKLFLGLIDEKNNIHAATLILITNISPGIKEAISPDGFLIDYADFDLVKVFTMEIKKYLYKHKVTYLITNPMYKHKVYNKKGNVIQNNEYILNNLYSLDYNNIEYSNDRL